MGVIKNYDSLAINENRKIALELIESAFASITPEEVFKTNFSLENDILKLSDESFDLNQFERIHLIGFGKGSAGYCKLIEYSLGEKLTQGFDIDTVESPGFNKVKYTKGTHPLPSQINIDFTKEVLSATENLSEKDLVLVVICGGGSAMFEEPLNLSFERLVKLFKDMLNSGADITEMNIVRKHVSKVKGGNLAKHLYPATVASLIFSDVPGNDLATIASGTTVKDNHSLDEAKAVIAKYNLDADVTDEDFAETPREDQYFEKVHNILMLSNLTAIHAMQKRAEELGYSTRVLTDHYQGDARVTGEKLISEASPGEILLAGGETTIKITGNGKGGRNQALALCSLPYLSEDILLAPFSTDGWDFYELAGAIVDIETVKKVRNGNVDVESYLKDDNSYAFFEKTGDGILTGKQESNVSDLYIVIKK